MWEVYILSCCVHAFLSAYPPLSRSFFILVIAVPIKVPIIKGVIMQLMQMILLSTFVVAFAHVLVERPDIREKVKTYMAGGIFVVLMLSIAVMLLSM